jgi:choline-phosphate cytidylyltransferase
MKRVYIDGVFDLFHKGHLESLIKAKNVLNNPENTILIVGVVSDLDCMSYKRKPIIFETDRLDIIKNIKMVDEVIFPCPLIVSPEFIKEHNIDLVVHGFSNDSDREKQKPFFEKIRDNFMEIEYYSKISTTDIIKNIINNYKCI